jgi:uncharacterized protein YrrD
MQFKENTMVKGTDGEDVGKIDRVVMDPRNGKITHLVVQKGMLFPEERVVDIDLVATANEDEVVLTEPADKLELPIFEEMYYLSFDQLDSSTAVRHFPLGYARPIFGYPPLGAQQALYPRGVRRNIPEDTLALKEGAKVYSSDEEHVGDVEKVFADPMNDRVTHFLIAKGLIFTEEKLIPIMWVQKASEYEVHLALGSEALRNLPDYQPES